MITAKCWVCRDRKHGVLYCNKCADSMERKAAAWDALWERYKQGCKAYTVFQEFKKQLSELENDDGKSQTEL